MARTYYVIDAFSSEPFTGNPAAVVLDAEGLDDKVMQSLAAEFNLSETTFILPPTSRGPDDGVALSVRFRWFTPTAEVDMCGHATIAGLQALLESGRVRHEDASKSTTVRIETRAGVLTGFIETLPGSGGRRMYWLDMIPPTLTPHELTSARLGDVLRLPVEAFEDSLPLMRTQDRDVIVFVQDFVTLNAARPDSPRLAELLDAQGLRGLSLATRNAVTPAVNVQSRFFAPNYGVDEDPVTGSVHGPLAAYLVRHKLVPVRDGLAGMTCVQGRPGGRTGLLHALVQVEGPDRWAVRIGGRATSVMCGTLLV